MALPHHVRDRLQRRKWLLAAEVPAAEPSRRAWVGVYPVGDPVDRFNVRYFEVERSALEDDWDISEADLVKRETIEVAGEQALEQVLARWIDDPTKLVQPVFCDYPI